MNTATRRLAPIAIGIALAATSVCAAPDASAQKTTTSLVQRGAALFDDQQYEESIQTLSAALLRPNATKRERVETYRLLAYNYIILKRTEEADAAVRGLLVLDETFVLPPSESPRFRDFFDATRKKWEAEGKPGKTQAAETAKPIKMDHASPAEVPPDTAVKLTGTIDDPEGKVRGIVLGYRSDTSGKFTTGPGTYTLGQFSAEIPGSAIKPPLVEYYLEAVDKAGLPLAARGDVVNPLRIVVPAPGGGGGVLASPFFWVPVGLAVVGGAIATAVIVSQSGKSTSHVTVNVTE